MSEENVEIVRTLAETFQRGELDDAFEFYDPNIVLDQSQNTQLPTELVGVYRGHDGVREFWRNWLAAWSEIQFEIDGVRDAGDDVVLLIGNQRHWGRRSGVVTDFQPYGMVFTVNGGKVVRLRSFATQEEALKAAGLSE
jgi:ketosteroid isomerase-like protein